ncbi:hypothetical protein Q7P37_007075 [Cladosporium fusiforme]
MGRGLLDLPEELISNIASKLGADDKCALRLACRALDEKSFHEFASEHFAGKCVHFTTDSLKALVGISHSRVAKYVKEVSVITALFSEMGFSCPGRETAHWTPTVRQSEAYKFYIKDQATIRTTKQDKDMLIEAFKSLPSLKTVEFIDSESVLKPHVDYRGSRKAVRETGTRPISGNDSGTRIKSEEFRKHHVHVWFTLVCSLAGAHETLALDELKAKFLSPHNFLSPQQLSFKSLTLERLSRVLKNTSRLHFDLKSPSDGKPYRDMLAKFAATTPNVKQLSLDFDSLTTSGRLCHRFTSPMDVSHLTSLSINSAAIHATHLIKLVSRLTEVKDLKLECVNLTEGSWPSVLTAISKLGNIAHLHLMFLREDECKCYFLKQRESASADGFMDDAFGNAFGNEWEDELDYADDDFDDDHSDGSMPDLEPADDPLIAGTPTDNDAAQELLSGASAHGDAKDKHFVTGDAEKAQDGVDDEENMPDYVPPGSHFDHGGERGFYICLEGRSLITKRLPTFIDQYNVGESVDHPGLGGLGAFAAMGGIAIPMPPPVPAPAAGVPAPPTFNALMAAFQQGFGLPPHNPNAAPGGAANANPPQPAATTAGGGTNTGPTTTAAPAAPTTTTTPGMWTHDPAWVSDDDNLGGMD